MDLSSVMLKTREKVTDALAATDGLSQLIAKLDADPTPPEAASQTAKEWLQWCQEQTDRVHVVESPVPAEVLPVAPGAAGKKAYLYDFKVQTKKRRVPDDKLYNQNPDLRQKVARGNTVMLIKGGGDESQDVYDGVVFALRKFTGGMGDEDENQPENDQVWRDYFLRPFSEVTRVVCTAKANGEAAHLSARFIDGHFVLFAGSKNVHLALRNRTDINKYKEARYGVAKEVASSVMDLIETLSKDKLSLFLSVLHHLRFTAVFEILKPSHQHVVNLSHLPESGQLQFISFVSPYDASAAEVDSYCAITPETGFKFCKFVGVPTVSYQVIDPKDADLQMDKVRRGYGYEGEVFYFVDEKEKVIGLLKKKTAWYVLCRAIREKVAYAVHAYEKNKGELPPDMEGKVTARISAIQSWLGFPDAVRDKWTELGISFLSWTIKKEKPQVRTQFPVLWKEFLDDTKKSDQIAWIDEAASNGCSTTDQQHDGSIIVTR